MSYPPGHLRRAPDGHLHRAAAGLDPHLTNRCACVACELGSTPRTMTVTLAGIQFPAGCRQPNVYWSKWDPAPAWTGGVYECLYTIACSFVIDPETPAIDGGRSIYATEADCLAGTNRLYHITNLVLWVMVTLTATQRIVQALLSGLLIRDDNSEAPAQMTVGEFIWHGAIAPPIDCMVGGWGGANEVTDDWFTGGTCEVAPGAF